MALVAENILAEALGLDEKSVQLRCVEKKWPLVKKSEQGGTGRYYIDFLLPEKIRQAVVEYQSKEQKSLVAANQQASERTTMIPESAKGEGLAKYQLIHAYRKVKQVAPHGQKSQAANDFLLGYNSGVLMASVFEKVGTIKKSTIDNLDTKLTENNDDYLCLCDGRGGWKKYGTKKWKGRGLSESAKAIFLKCYLNQSRPSVAMAIRGTRMTLKEEKNITEPASDKTFRRWFKDYEKHNAHVVCMAREGVKAYTDKFGAYADRDAALLKVGQCLVADGKTLNFFILHPETGRPVRMTLIVFLDWRSRYPVGWQIMPTENTLGILAAFRNAVATLGDYPQSVYLDNGKAFKSKFFTETNPNLEELTGLYARVGTAVTFAKPYNGRAKVVERFYRTIQEQLEFMMPSYCGDSITTKPAWMSRNETFHQAWHDAKTKNWIPTIREAAYIIKRYFEWYANQPHNDLEGTPADIFLPHKGTGVDPIQLNHDFLWRKEVTPHNCRITLWNIDYEADGLHGLSKKHKVIAMFDTADMRKVWCYTQDGEYLCEADPVAALHPLAKLFGGEVALEQVHEHNKRLRKLTKDTKQQLAAAGISKETQEAMNVLPFAKKVPILIDGHADDPELPAPKPALPEPRGKEEAEIIEISDDEAERLEALLNRGDQEKDPIPEAEIVDEDELSHLESLLDETENEPFHAPEEERGEGDELSRLEALTRTSEEQNDSELEEPQETAPDDQDEELKRLEMMLNQSEQSQKQPREPEQASEDDEIERLNKLLGL